MNNLQKQRLASLQPFELGPTLPAPVLEKSVDALRRGITHAWEKWRAQEPESQVVISAAAHETPLVQQFAEAGVRELVKFAGEQRLDVQPGGMVDALAKQAVSLVLDVIEWRPATVSPLPTLAAETLAALADDTPYDSVAKNPDDDVPAYRLFLHAKSLGMDHVAWNPNDLRRHSEEIAAEAMRKEITRAQSCGVKWDASTLHDQCVKIARRALGHAGLSWQAWEKVEPGRMSQIFFRLVQERPTSGTPGNP